VAVTRRIKPGHETEFQAALRDFFQASFVRNGVNGASMLVPPPGSNSSEFGILRTFASEQERDAFYASPMFKAWEDRVRPLTEGEPTHRELTGLEAWFRYPNPPPRWKMALLTFIAVWPVSIAVPAALRSLIGQSAPGFVFAGAVAAGIVVILTWIVMPLLVLIAKGWLHPK
ncbi:MAG TPA: antibiotic biosynthesis monooxygenase, partial [Verrucomicrobiae bacterium]|nr:antibiotic biosynthesis monooxygenase [Verrucomicrobiae bacterium]